MSLARMEETVPPLRTVRALQRIPAFIVKLVSIDTLRHGERR